MGHCVPETSTALNKYKRPQQFFRWLRDDEQAIDRNPMQRVRPPKTPSKLDEADTAMGACRHGQAPHRPS